MRVSVLEVMIAAESQQVELMAKVRSNIGTATYHNGDNERYLMILGKGHYLVYPRRHGQNKDKTKKVVSYMQRGGGLQTNRDLDHHRERYRRQCSLFMGAEKKSTNRRNLNLIISNNQGSKRMMIRCLPPHLSCKIA